MQAKKIKPGQLDAHITADEWAESGRWVEVESSNVKGIAYVGGQLFVEFKGGSIYSYDVQPTYAKQMFYSTSMGKFVWKMRRAGIPYSRVQ